MAEIDRTDELIGYLRAINDALRSDRYEHLGIWTVGGPNGTYTLKSPVNTEAEFALYGVSATGACAVQVSQNSGANQLDITGAASYGGGGGSASNALEGSFITINAAAPLVSPGNLFWQPAGRGASIYVLISGLSAAAAFVLVAWRRYLDRVIPDAPHARQHSPLNRPSMRPQRVLAGQSIMEAGLQEGRDVLPGGLPYQHIDPPTPAQMLYDRALKRVKRG